MPQNPTSCWLVNVVLTTLGNAFCTDRREPDILRFVAGQTELMVKSLTCVQAWLGLELQNNTEQNMLSLGSCYTGQVTFEHTLCMSAHVMFCVHSIPVPCEQHPWIRLPA